MRMGRRDVLKAAAVVVGAGAAAEMAEGAVRPRPGPRPPSRLRLARGMPPSQAYLFFTAPEAAFVVAAVEVMLPDDDDGPGGVEAGVPLYIDRQLAGATGSGAGLYRGGPWRSGTPLQGPQLSLSPAELYRQGIAETDMMAREAAGRGFAALPPERRDDVLSGLAGGDIALDTVPGKLFVAMLHAHAVEGYFADPAYGGNRGMAAWRMLGFPGGLGDYAEDLPACRDRRFAADPVSLADLQ